MLSVLILVALVAEIAAIRVASKFSEQVLDAFNVRVNTTLEQSGMN